MLKFSSVKYRLCNRWTVKRNRKNCFLARHYSTSFWSYRVFVFFLLVVCLRRPNVDQWHLQTSLVLSQVQTSRGRRFSVSRVDPNRKVSTADTPRRLSTSSVASQLPAYRKVSVASTGHRISTSSSQCPPVIKSYSVIKFTAFWIMLSALNGMKLGSTSQTVRK